jgi:Uma2 family endonuclease
MATIHDFEETETLPIPGRRMTEDEFGAWCLDHENVKAEWVDGEVVVMSPVNRSHMRLAEFLLRVLSEFVERQDLGEVHGGEFINRFLAGTRVTRRLPDLWFITKNRLNLIQPTYLDGPPDLVIEIVSPDSVARDWREKFLDYQSAGVREYWIIDPMSETVETSRLAGGAFERIAEVDGRIASEKLPGFFLRPEWLWQEPLPNVRDVLRELGANP